MMKNTLWNQIIAYAMCTLWLSSCLCSPPQKRLNIAIWSRYLTDEAIQTFTQTTGITLSISIFYSNEELLAKVQSGNTGIDLIFPSDYMVTIMSQLELLAPIDKTKLKNFHELDANILNQPFDPDNKHSIPFDWGTSGIAWNTEKIPQTTLSWKELFTLEALKGKFSLLDDAKEVIGAALKVSGRSVNDISIGAQEDVKKVLSSIKGSIHMFTSEPIMAFTTGEVFASHLFMTDAILLQQKNAPIAYNIPQEGSVIWVDNFAILKDSPHQEEAYTFMNFFMTDQSMATISNKLFVAPVNKQAIPLLMPIIKDHPWLFPSKNTIKRLEYLKDHGENTRIWDKIWTEFKSQ